ncbi:toluene tolerance family protein [Magnetococcus marinus MC-1]|uniref:Toluene tolerance family protein n=1 Tax=Magnetococcus marinus (strain ATCC BAA-1437 / JCM 17883 / MC-1) TaxID=156889 RepID=A0LBZ9_MAGMM|nr:ABC transporter substrate-binding protein [Magnetococcus marinus]ABK45492.1 toluene tolerance family protein [Magnetococcus marinus MC-1]
MIQHRTLAILYFLVALLLPLSSQAEPPTDPPATDAIQRSIKLALELLRDPAMAKPDMLESRRDKLRALIYGHFDFAMMSRGAIGSYWSNFTQKQKESFIDLFRQTLEDAYLDKVESYRGKGAEFAPEQRKSARIIILDSHVDLGGTPIKLTYLCLETPQGWKVVDLVLEGVSIIANYRKQFQYLLQQHEVEEMLEMLRKKIESNRQARMHVIDEAKAAEKASNL